MSLRRTFMYTGSRFSESAKKVATLLGIRRIRHRNSRYRARTGDKVINWGASESRPGMSVVRWFNRPPLRGINKLTCFNILRGANVSIPEYTTSRNAVDRDHTWLARHTVTGSGGRGITIINPGDNVPSAPLYVKYVPKKYEVRIHVANGETFDVQQKMFRRGTAGDVNHKIRSHDNGFIFVRHGLSIPTAALVKCHREAVKAVVALGMDFGAVDVIFNERQDKAFVLEVNSSPGVEASTATNYANMLRRMVNGG
jgi:hypothetical protein